MNCLRSLFLLGTIVGLASCATYDSEKKDRETTIAANQRSYVIGRYAVECEPHARDCLQAFNSISVRYHSTAGQEFTSRINSTRGAIFGGDTTYDFVSSEKREKGFYFCELVPAGEHEFYTFDFANFAGGGSGFYLKKEDQFKLPFPTAAGEVIYVGRLKVTTSAGKNFLGMNLPAPGVLLLSSAPDDDVSAALQKCPEGVRSARVRNSLLQASMTGGSVLVRDEYRN